MNQLTKVFEKQNLTIIEVGEDFHFLLNDVCKVLDLSPRVVRQRLDEDVCSTYPLQTAGGRQQATFVNEDGLYDVVLDSRKPEAKRFRKWITSEVLPSIRKTGSYQKPISQLEVMQMAVSELSSHDKRITNLEDNMRIDSAQEQRIRDNTNRVVVKALGGKDSAAYKSISRKVFPLFWREFKRYFEIPRYGDLPKVRFDEAIEFISEWTPSTSLKFEIRAMNNQQHLKLVE